MNAAVLATPWVRRSLCLVAESGIVVTAFVTAVLLRFHYGLGEGYESELLVLKALLVTFVLIVCFYYNELYEDRVTRRRLEFVLRLLQSFVVGMVLLSLVYYAVPSLTVGRGIFLIFTPLVLGAVILRRSVYLWAFGRAALSDVVLILGTGQTAQQVAIEMLRREPLGYRTAGFLGEHRAEVGRRLVNPSVIGTVEDLLPLVERHRVSLVVVALEDRRGRLPVGTLLRCRLAGVRVEEAPSFYERLTGKILLSNLRPSWLVFSRGFHKPRLLRNTKRLIELGLSMALIVVTTPLLGLLAVLIKLDSQGPVIYRQTRVGERGGHFAVYKLRTMRVDAEASTGPVWAAESSDPRVTRVGRWLRKLRLDELLQLFNVARGEMSFVGPRPERPEFVDKLGKIIPYYNERHSVRPGITGWAQVNFPYGATIEDAEEKLTFDLYYIKNMSLLFDVAIVVATLKVMLFGKGAR